jgi:hypothetical protein
MKKEAEKELAEEKRTKESPYRRDFPIRHFIVSLALNLLAAIDSEAQHEQSSP